MKKLVTARKEGLVDAWVLRCAACGKLGSFRRFWDASRAVQAHEAMHEENEAEENEPASGGLRPEPGAG
jgi:hypothetical protein